MKLKFTIKQARNYAGLTQKQMAQKMNVSLAAYQAYEWGNVPMRMDKADDFSKIVGIKLENIIFLQVN